MYRPQLVSLRDNLNFDTNRDLIGSGVFGDVYRATLRGGGGAEGDVVVALKVIRRTLIDEAQSVPGMASTLRRGCRTEVETLSRLVHPNIVRLKGFTPHDDSVPLDQIGLCYELMETDVHKLLFREGVAEGLGIQLDAVVSMNIMVDITRGLTYLHGQCDDVIDEQTLSRTTVPCLHRDIKSANIGICIVIENIHGFIRRRITAKLFDFGQAKLRRSDPEQSNLRSVMSVTGGANNVGTPGYMAPEILSGTYGVKSEEYSFGVIMLELLTKCKAHDSRRESGNELLVDDIEYAREDHCNEFDQYFYDNFVHDIWKESMTTSNALSSLAFRCIERRSIRRPASMRTILLELVDIRAAYMTEMSLAPPIPPPSASTVVNRSSMSIAELRAHYIALAQQLEVARRITPNTPSVVPSILEPSAQPLPIAMRHCCICFDEKEENEGITCLGSERHFHCKDCFYGYVASKCPPVSQYEENGAPLLPISIPDLTATGRPDGSIYCAMRTGALDGGACSSEPFSDMMVAHGLPYDGDEAISTVYDNYINLKSLIAQHSIVREWSTRLQEELARVDQEDSATRRRERRREFAAQLRRDMPNARQCRQCSFGPVDHFACSSLNYHHGENVRGGGFINNACPQCGWFSNNVHDWPMWNGQLLGDLEIEVNVAAERENQARQAREDTVVVTPHNIDYERYFRDYPDVRACSAFGQRGQAGAWDHYNRYGRTERRVVHALSNPHSAVRASPATIDPLRIPTSTSSSSPSSPTRDGRLLISTPFGFVGTLSLGAPTTSTVYPPDAYRGFSPGVLRPARDAFPPAR